MLRLNTLLTKRGFININPARGINTSASWYDYSTKTRFTRMVSNGTKKVFITKPGADRIVYELPKDEEKVRDYIYKNFG